MGFVWSLPTRSFWNVEGGSDPLRKEKPQHTTEQYEWEAQSQGPTKACKSTKTSYTCANDRSLRATFRNCRAVNVAAVRKRRIQYGQMSRNSTGALTSYTKKNYTWSQHQCK
ncbi:hypothetical protein MTO96_051229 [Rhipicephalus appendiculatus]